MRSPVSLLTFMLLVALLGCSDSITGDDTGVPGGSTVDLATDGEGGSGFRGDGGGSSGGSSSGGDEPQAGTLTAGDIDDNLNFTAFTEYLNDVLQEAAGQSLPSVRLNDRITIRVEDGLGQGIYGAEVRLVADDGSASFVGTTSSNGVFYFFPTFDGFSGDTWVTATVRAPGGTDAGTLRIDLANPPSERRAEVVLHGARAAAPARLDLLLILDTTGSMSDELDYLTTEFRSIVTAVRSAHPSVDMRFGLIVYRDEGDAYVVRSMPFTSSADQMRLQLAAQSADGGGDYPEAVDQALAAAVDMEWRRDALRLVFHVADAPPHDDRLQAALEQAVAARAASIRLHAIAASGVATTAEYMMRIAAAVTQSRYLFLTDDSGVGNEHAEPTVPCYVVTRLDQLMTRVIASELSGTRVEPMPDEIIRTVGRYDGGVCAAQ